MKLTSLMAPMPTIQDCHHVVIQRNAIIKAIIDWLDINQPDVFTRGIWDAINSAMEIKETE